MTYHLAIICLGGASTEITPEEFERIRRAQANVMIALSIEEKFEILIENYSEYERSLLDLTVARMLRQDHCVDTGSDDRQLINRRIANLLMAARLYIDQVQHDFIAMYGRDSDRVKDLRAALRREYDRSLGYRVMEAVRNYAQHRSLPVGTIKYNSELHEEGGRNCIRFRIEACVHIEGLRRDPSFKASVLNEMEHDQSSLDLTLAARHYVSGLSRIQLAVRELSARDVGDWGTTIATTIEKARREIGQTLGLAAVKVDGEQYVETINLVDDILKRCQKMRCRYQHLGHLSNWYVSGRRGGAGVPPQ